VIQSRYARSSCLLILLAGLACGGDEVSWGDVTYRAPDPRDSVRAALAPPLPESLSPKDTGCFGSVRVSSAGNTTYAVWWTVRNDSSGVLELSRKTGSGLWGKSVAVDTTDHSTFGCSRPAPSIFADSAGGYVHIAYFLEPRSGAGIFAIHSMDSGATFHSPVPIAFGKQQSETAIAADHDRVAVAYEQPIGERTQIFTSLSTTAGHIFGQGVPVSEENADAEAPRIGIFGTKLEVSWLERLPRHPASERTAFRIGTWK
jgi:hypothetical protein